MIGNVCMSMLNNFTKQACSVVMQAIKTAEELGHTFVGSEHLLYGLCYDENYVSDCILGKRNIKGKDILQQIISHNSSGEKTILSVKNLTPKAHDILQNALIEAKTSNSINVGSEHILLALLKQGDCSAVQIIRDIGVNSIDFYSDILQEITPQNSAIKHLSDTSTKKNKHNKHRKVLSQYGKNLSEIARENKLDPVSCRDEEISRLSQILSRRTKNNPCLIGEPGVGKTAIVEGLAQKISVGDISDNLVNKEIISIDLSNIVSGAKYRGDFEQRLNQIITEATQDDEIILFIDEIHTIVGAGSAEGAIDAANILKPHLARGNLQIIGATTIREYNRYIKKDAALERRFQQVIVNEPSSEDSIKMIKNLKPLYEKHHNIIISDEAIKAAVTLSSRYIVDKYLPDKAIDILDEAASNLNLYSHRLPLNLLKMQNSLQLLKNDKEHALLSQNYDTAQKYRNLEKEMLDIFIPLKEKWIKKISEETLVLNRDDIINIISKITEIPKENINNTTPVDLSELKDKLSAKIIGQNEAISAVVSSLCSSRVGLSDENKPICSMMFLGESGVGKTGLCKELAEILFGDKKHLIKLDMSEYMEKHSVSKLLGSPPGYVGYENTPSIIQHLKLHPHSIILFDEIEKAHPDVVNLLLQILDEGVLTTADGEKVNFKNMIVIMTSNIGAKLAFEHKHVGFFTSTSKSSENFSIMQTELSRHFPPEFIARIDDVIFFNALSYEDIEKIAEIEMAKLNNKLIKLNYNIEFDISVIEQIAKTSFSSNKNARNIKHNIKNQIQNFITDNILSKNILQNLMYIISYEDSEFLLKNNIFANAE